MLRQLVLAMRIIASAGRSNGSSGSELLIQTNAAAGTRYALNGTGARLHAVKQLPANHLLPKGHEPLKEKWRHMTCLYSAPREGAEGAGQLAAVLLALAPPAPPLPLVQALLACCSRSACMRTASSLPWAMLHWSPLWQDTYAAKALHCSVKR
jgi:hypothetical protein